eukprot:CAMPEP_0194202774 /NCGR_PEP_ID=MMETSP0156-20130528/2712_1 /TAXON_ID=33649 /ORGANISM="Thalassionema nitzschioides, Strain L26-B" /LENGTH=94 /DNA_ID=CAMNT_0038928355 /DNA_START=27 /DNA_END=311 /DNA_ORIENTATION=-
MTTTTTIKNQHDAFPYVCQLDISFPTKESAQRTCSVLKVDEEIGNRVQKTISHHDDENMVRVLFRATEAKMLRVAVSTFCDYVTVALKCQQEFA